MVARAALQECLRAGAREFVICGGARNIELVAALSSAEGSIKTWTLPEERSAAFFALGRARVLDAPVVVITTSGTAVAELLPAVIEAHYQAVPLIVLSADRPKRFRGSGAPQAIEQVGMFAGYAQPVLDIDEVAQLDGAVDGWDRRQPLHMNLCLEEPQPEAVQQVSVEPLTVPSNTPTEPCRADASELIAFLEKDPVILLGELPHSWQAGVKGFIQRVQASFYAEAGSGLREDSEVAAFRVSEATLPRYRPVLRIGGVPALRFWRDLEQAPDLPVLSIAPNGLPGLARPSAVMAPPDWDQLSPTARSGQGDQEDLTELLETHPDSEPSWFRTLSEAIPTGAMVFLGNSLPIREWNRFATFEDRQLRCAANRGANGIDGTVASFLGMASDEPEAWLILGDLSAVYDLAAPWMLQQLGDRRLRIVVINNGGGMIFRRLPALMSASERAQQQVENRHQLAFKPWADLWGMGYRAVKTKGDLQELPDGAAVLEINPDNAESEAVWKALAAG